MSQEPSGTGEKRSKLWKELNQEEKIERMRYILKDATATIEALRKQVRMLKEHRHVDGKVYYADILGGDYFLQQTNSDEVYF